MVNEGAHAEPVVQFVGEDAYQPPMTLMLVLPAVKAELSPKLAAPPHPESHTI